MKVLFVVKTNMRMLVMKVMIMLVLVEMVVKNLKFPLAGHDFGVDAAHVDAGFDAGFHVFFHDVAAVHFVGSDAAVVWALWGWESVFWPAEGGAALEEGVFLFEAEPGFLVFHLFGNGAEFGAGVAGVGGDAVGHEHFTHDEDVWGATDGVVEDAHGLQVAVALVAGGLVGAAAVESPVGEGGHVGHFVDAGQNLGFAA